MIDWSGIDEASRAKLFELAEAICNQSRRVANEICQLGKLLSDARELIGERTKGKGSLNLWGEFCRSELSIEPRNAARWIRVYEAFGDRCDGAFVQTALEMLSQPCVPEAARDDARKLAAAGERVNVSSAREIIAKRGTQPIRGSNAGKAEPLPGIEASDVLYKVRSALRQAFRNCPPDKRPELREKLNKLIDELYHESAAAVQPRSRGPSTPKDPPDTQEIARRAAEIRAGWTPEERHRRMEGNASINQKKKARRMPV